MSDGKSKARQARFREVAHVTSSAERSARLMLRLVGAVLTSGDMLATQAMSCREADDIAYALASCGETDTAATLLSEHAMGKGQGDELHGHLIDDSGSAWVADHWELAQDYVRRLALGEMGVPGVQAQGEVYRVCGKHFTDYDGAVLQCTNLDGVGHDGECDQ